MLPDYPEIKREIQIKFQNLLKREIQKDSLIGIIPKKYVYEGNFLNTTSIDGYQKNSEYQSISAEFRVKPEDIIERGLDAYYSKVPEIGRELAKKQNESTIKAIDEATNRVGNCINCKSKPASEWYLEAIDKMHINFDNFGNPLIPDLFVSPGDYERIKNDLAELSSDPIIQEKLKEIIDRKKGIWIDRESNRKLVD